MSRIKFREWLIEEETDWEALKAAIAAGLEAYQKTADKKPAKKEQKGKKLKAQVMQADNEKDLEKAVEEIMANGYTLRPWGNVQKKPAEDLHKWILEWLQTYASVVQN